HPRSAMEKTTSKKPTRRDLTKEDVLVTQRIKQLRRERGLTQFAIFPSHRSSCTIKPGRDSFLLMNAVRLQLSCPWREEYASLRRRTARPQHSVEDDEGQR